MERNKDITVHDLDDFSTRVVQQLNEIEEMHRVLKVSGRMPRELGSMMRRAEASLRVIGDEIKQMSISEIRKRV